MFLPEGPSAYATTFPSFVLDAIPGARDLDTAVQEAFKALDDARAKEGIARAKLRALSADGHPSNGPAADVKRAAWERADDEYRALPPRTLAAEAAYKRAQQARFAHVATGSEHPDFIAQARRLFDAANARAEGALGELVKALKERDEFASSMGLVLSIPGGWPGIDAATSDISAYIAEGLRDRIDVARDLLNDVIGSRISLGSRLSRSSEYAEAIHAANTAIEAAVNSGTDPVDAVETVLRRRGLLRGGTR